MQPDLTQLLAQRRSVRAYLPDPVPRAAVARICTAARMAPSGANLQPGKFHVLAGYALDGLKTCLSEAVTNGAEIESEYSYFPPTMSAGLKARQRAAGFALYNALGIARRDVAARRANFDRNYRFFDAPVGIIVTIDRDMGKGCFMDLGLSMMALFLAAEAEGYGTSGIGAIANYGSVVRKHLDLPADEMVVCGIALGRADPDAAVNQFKTDRAPLADFTSFHGFDPE